MRWAEIKEAAETVLLFVTILGIILSPLIVKWGRKNLGISGVEMRVEALEKEDLKIRTDQARTEGDIKLLEKRIDDVEKRDAAIERMDRRLYRVAVLLSQQHPDDAKNLKLLEDL